MKIFHKVALISVSSALLFTSCGEKKAEDNTIFGEVKGKIIVLTNRTDIVDTKLQDYKMGFELLYPNASVEFEAITDYEGTVRTRMSTKEYGDVLCKPNLNAVDYPSFFEPLGTLSDFSAEYNFTNTATPISYQDKVYAFPLVAVVGGGVVYNKSVFREAGVAVPRTTEDFYAALEAIKAKTAAVPLCMNYPAQWTLNQWEDAAISFSGNSEFKNELIHKDSPFVAGGEHYELYRVMYEVVKRGLCEKDMLATDWELSKQDLADGKIGCMVLGSWAIPQVRALAKNPEDIGYMPFPASANGKKYAEAVLDMPLCINVHSKNKATAYAWIKYMAEKSDWVAYTEAIPCKKGAPYPDVLESFGEMNVNYIQTAAPKASEEDVFGNLDKESEIGFSTDPEKKRIVDAAMGSSGETFDDIMADWNERWNKARKTLGID